MGNSVLSCYNVCGMSGRENTPFYINAIEALLMQDLPGHKVAVSGCLTTDGTKVQLEGYFGKDVSFNWVEEPVPLSPSCNDTIEKCVKHYGAFDAYAYWDSGIYVGCPTNDNCVVKTLYDVFNSGPYSLVAGMPTNDDGREWWRLYFKPGQDFIFPVGKATNMHCQLFSNEWLTHFKRLLPDIFGSHCMESVFSVMAASLPERYQYIMTQKVRLLHVHSMDGASLYSRSNNPDFSPMSKQFQASGVLFKTKKTIDDIYRDGYEFGIGIEECSEYWRHDPTKFDSNFRAIDPRLKDFCAKAFYLTKDEFDYSQMKTIWNPGRKD